MNKRDAQKLLSELKLYDDDPKCEYAPPPTEKEFDRFSKEFGIELPASYRAFISVFGPGELGRVFRIQSPYCVRSHWDIAKLYRECKAAVVYPFELKCYKDFNQYKRLIPCVSSFLGPRCCFFWDPNDFTDKGRHKYGIYVPRDFQFPTYF